MMSRPTPVKKVMLLNPPGSEIYLRDYYCSHTSKANYIYCPYDLFAQSGWLATEFDVEAIDAIADRLSPGETLRRIVASGCDTVLFMTGAVSWVEDFAFMERVWKETGRRLRIIGNGDILWEERGRFIERYQWLEGCMTDFTTRDLLDHLLGTQAGEPIPNIFYRHTDGRIIDGGLVRRKGVWAMPRPRHEMFPIARYRVPHGRRLPYSEILTDYGCVYQCTYCIGGDLGFRTRDIDNSMEEIHFLTDQLGVREIRFKDLTFGAVKKHAEGLMDRMIADQVNLTWICLSRPSVLTPELLEKMKAAGCHTIQMGLESADAEFINQYKKALKQPAVYEILRVCRDLGIRVLAHFILGLPGDTPERIERTINYALELDPAYASFNIAMPRLGTRFRQDALKAGLITEDTNLLDNSISYPILETSELSKEELWRLRNRAIRRFYLRPGYMWRRLAGVRSAYELKTLFTEGWSLLRSTT
ncbi:MAG: radical SAM protein [Candidatus Sumerlaeia bacterium]|nr:radical SAM protein [Candidatus Sumerlaeia bacterium]